MALKSRGAMVAAFLRRRVIRPVILQVHADDFRIRLHEGDDEHARDDQNRQEEPGQAQRVQSGLAPKRFCDEDERGTEQKATKRTERDVAERLAAHGGREHVRRANAHLLRAAHAHAEREQASDKQRDALRDHRAAEHQRADERERKPQKDAGLAAVGIGDLAHRVGDEEPANADERDGKAREPGRTGEADHHERPKSVAELHARARERLRDREQSYVALDEGRDLLGHGQ